MCRKAVNQSSTSCGISNSILVAASLDFPLPIWWKSIPNTSVRLLNPENMGLAFEIAPPSILSGDQDTAWNHWWAFMEEPRPQPSMDGQDLHAIFRKSIQTYL